MAATAGNVWSGDLRDFSVRHWADDSEIAAIAAASGKRGIGWLNLRHVTPPLERIVTKWCSHAAARHAPWDVLYASDLADLAVILGIEQRATEAE